MVCYKVNLYKNYDQLNERNEQVGQVIVERKENGIVKEMFTQNEIRAYLTADKPDEAGNILFLPHYDDQKGIDEEIAEDGFSLFVVNEDLTEENEATKEDLDYYRDYPERYTYNQIMTEKNEKGLSK